MHNDLLFPTKSNQARYSHMMPRPLEFVRVAGFYNQPSGCFLGCEFPEATQEKPKNLEVKKMMIFEKTFFYGSGARLSIFSVFPHLTVTSAPMGLLFSPFLEVRKWRLNKQNSFQLVLKGK